ncbi:MAG: hypothetical protein M3N30_00615 [Bacteroidota bacterium]|nr:hypothetical protein [Bacteroidota bacterium]
MTVTRSHIRSVGSKSSFTKNISVFEYKKKSWYTSPVKDKPKPPSNEEIIRLNRIASQPPFSIIFKTKDFDDPR